MFQRPGVFTVQVEEPAPLGGVLSGVETENWWGFRILLQSLRCEFICPAFQLGDWPSCFVF